MKGFTNLIENGLNDISMFFEVIGFSPKENYTYDSLKELEKITDEIYPEGHEPKPTTMIPYGLYLGKTLIENVKGAQWVNADQDIIWDVGIKFKMKGKGNMIVYPFTRVNTWWRSREDSISSIIKMAEFVTTFDTTDEKVMKKYMDEDGWIHFAGGDCFRMTEEPKKKNHE